MSHHTTAQSTWHQTLSLLHSLGHTVARHVPVLPASASQPGRRGEQTVEIVERLSSTTLAVAWRDPTSCCYGYQLWQIGRARIHGCCALTGKTILIGDWVYRPRRGRERVLNADAMILSESPPVPFIADHTYPEN